MVIKFQYGALKIMYMKRCENSSYPLTDESQVAQASGGVCIHKNTDVKSQDELEEGSAEGGVGFTVGDVLTTRQLLVRRGLAVLLMLLILSGGIVLNKFLTDLLK